jgi:hypothetical protein
MVSGGQGSLKKRGLTADRIARLLLHRVATDSELEAIRLDKLSEDASLERLVASWISSDEFDRVWSARLANFYMGGRIESSQQAVVFREWLATQIELTAALNQGYASKNPVQDESNVTDTPAGSYVPKARKTVRANQKGKVSARQLRPTGLGVEGHVKIATGRRMKTGRRCTRSRRRVR